MKQHSSLPQTPPKLEFERSDVMEKEEPKIYLKQNSEQVEKY
jgi:hypothetical protein